MRHIHTLHSLQGKFVLLSTWDAEGGFLTHHFTAQALKGNGIRYETRPSYTRRPLFPSQMATQRSYCRLLSLFFTTAP